MTTLRTIFWACCFLSSPVQFLHADPSQRYVIGWGINQAGQATGIPSVRFINGAFVTTDNWSATGAVMIASQILSNAVAVSAGVGHSLAIRGDGTVVGWTSQPSSNQYGQLLPVENLSNVVAFAVGPGGYVTQGVALKNDGTVGIWGSQSIYKEATPPVDLSNVIAIAVGDGHTLALKNDGTVIGWGFNKVGQATGVPTTNSPNISAGQFTIGGQILSNVVSITANHDYSMALKKDGTVILWGQHMVNDLYPITVPVGLSNVVAIAAGDNYCLAITTNSAVADKFLN
jgi:trimeric autotransporter adhesin